MAHCHFVCQLHSAIQHLVFRLVVIASVYGDKYSTDTMGYSIAALWQPLICAVCNYLCNLMQSAALVATRSRDCASLH